MGTSDNSKPDHSVNVVEGRESMLVTVFLPQKESMQTICFYQQWYRDVRVDWLYVLMSSFELLACLLDGGQY